jgi:hypothetical protein
MTGTIFKMIRKVKKRSRLPLSTVIWWFQKCSCKEWLGDVYDPDPGPLSQDMDPRIQICKKNLTDPEH